MNKTISTNTGKAAIGTALLGAGALLINYYLDRWAADQRATAQQGSTFAETEKQRDH